MNNPTLALFWANIKMLMRDRQSLFWSLVFPLLFLVIFGLFNFDAPQKFNIQIFDQSQTDLSRQLIDQLNSFDVFTLKTYATQDEANEALKTGDLEGIITIPAEYGKTDPKDIKEPMKFNVVVDGSNPQTQIVPTILTQFLDNVNLQAVGAPKIFSVESASVQGHNVRYIDFLMPGILGMAIMFSSIIGIAVGITRFRERQILKRLIATPINIRSFLVAEVGSYLFLSLMQIAVILIVGRLLFNIHIYGNYFYLIVATLIGTVTFLNIGFFVAGIAKVVNTAEAMSNAITTPMMFLSGVFFSTEMLPKIVAKIVDFLPLTSLLQMLRGIAIDGKTFADFPSQLAILAGWILLSFSLAWRTFRFVRA